MSRNPQTLWFAMQLRWLWIPSKSMMKLLLNRNWVKKKKLWPWSLEKLWNLALKPFWLVTSLESSMIKWEDFTGEKRIFREITFSWNLLEKSREIIFWWNTFFMKSLFTWHHYFVKSLSRDRVKENTFFREIIFYGNHFFWKQLAWKTLFRKITFLVKPLFREIPFC